MQTLNDTWTKRTYVCDPNECDTLIEVTTKDEFGWPSGDVRIMKCPCGRITSLVSEADATIVSNNERKEMQNDELQEARNRINLLEQRLEYQEKQLGQILNNLTVEGWYSDSVEKEEVLRDLCTIMDHEVKRTLNWTATITVSGNVDVPIEEVDSFDIRYFLNDELSIDTNYGDMIVDSWHVEDIDNEDWN